MLKDPSQKYRPFPPIDLPGRQWPSRTITKAPLWCSVDLRDGNQALVDPMDAERKMRFFDLLVRCGFREIEVGFPSASQTDFDFTRALIESKKAEGIVLQVLVPARKELIEKTFDAVRDAPSVIVHLYNSTSPVQRRVVFQKEPDDIVALAVEGASFIKKCAARFPRTQWTFEYSPESFTATELDFALRITDAVMDVWRPTAAHKAIVNLPATVEVATPNVYADQIEYFCGHVRNRENVIISVHPHNDRGTAVAAAELALLAGADRVEGTLFGNGERTGNVDLVTLALNLYTQGVAPQLDFSHINEFVKVAEHCTQIPVHPRHPYAGELVFTAFSGSHQDAIRKGLRARKPQDLWDVPYLPIDSADVGRAYEPIIRINSQSGKGGIAFVLEEDHGFHLPKKLQAAFSRRIQKVADESGHALSSQTILDSFLAEYMRREDPLAFVDYKEETKGNDCRVAFSLTEKGLPLSIQGEGNGLLDALTKALSSYLSEPLDILSYSEHAATVGSTSQAIAYIETANGKWASSFGVGMDTNFAVASLKALLSSINRGLQNIS